MTVLSTPPRTSAAGVMLGAGAAVSFGTIPIFGKRAYDLGAETVPLLGFRFCAAAALMLAFLLLTHRRVNVGSGKIVQLLLLGGVGYAFEASLYFAAVERAPAGPVSLVFYSFPMWTYLLALALRMERFHHRTLVALVLGSAGVASIFSISGLPLDGLLLALGAAVAVAFYFILAQVVLEGVPASAGALWTAAGAALSLTAIAAGTRTGLPAEALPNAAALGVVTAVAFVLMYAAIARIGSAKTTVANMLEPVTTVLLAAVWLAEPLTARVLLGTVLIASALPVLAGGRRAQPPKGP